MALSKREKQVLDKLVEVDDAQSAAESLHLSSSTVYNMLYRLRKKQRKARLLINTLLAYKRKSELINRVLSSKVTAEEEKQLLKDVEDLEEETGVG